MICLSCVELRDASPDNTCATCGSTLHALNAGMLDELVRERFKRKIWDWQAQELVDTHTAGRLVETLYAPPPESPPEPAVIEAPPPEPPLTLEQKADALAARVDRLEDWRPSWGRSFFLALESTARKEREELEVRESGHPDRDDVRLASDSGQALFHRADAGAFGGLGALADLDADAPGDKDAAPRLHEYVWWFLGAVLVLGGSLMGVREAWRALGGVPRQLLVTGALFAYHAGFVGLGVFLSRRSAPVGRVLASIGIALLPVAFVALSALVGLEPSLGAAVAVGLTGMSLLTLRPTARLLFGSSSVSLWAALLPSLLAGLPLMSVGEAPGTRTLCALVGVGAMGAAAWRASKEKSSRAGLAVLSTGLYGALALALFTVASAPIGFDSLSPGSPLLTGLTLWGLALATVVAGVASQESAREAHPQAAPVVETLAHAVVAGAALLAAASAFARVPGEEPWLDLASALTPVVAALAYFLLEPRRRALTHPAVLSLTLAGVLLARLNHPTEPSAWMVGIAAVSAGLLVLARLMEQGRLRDKLLGWGVVLALVSLPLSTTALSPWDGDNPWPQLTAGLIVAVSAHLTGGYRLRGLHYLGGLGLLVAVWGAAQLVPTRETLAFPELGWTLQLMLGVGATVYAGAGLLQALWSRRESGRDDLWPLDDLSLVVATVGLLGGPLLVARPLVPETLPWAAGLSCLPPALLAGLLLLRARRDGSRLVSVLAAWGVAVSIVRYVSIATPYVEPVNTRAVLFAALTLGFCTLAMFRGRRDAKESPPKGRRLIGWIRLPFGESGRTLYTDGFATVAFVGMGLTLFLLSLWMPVPVEAERANVVLAGGLLVACTLLVFLSRGFVSFGLRGAVLTLAAVGALIAFTAVLNRAGRPLPPDVVALRLPLIGVGLWLVALGTRRIGPWLSHLLEKGSHGHTYEFVPHMGVFVLSVLLAVEAWHLGSPGLSRSLTVVPPLMPLGAGLLALLLAYSFDLKLFANLGLLLALPGAMLWAAHGALLGHPLAAMDPPGGRWVRAELLERTRGLDFWLHTPAWLPDGERVSHLWYLAFAGLAAAGLAYAVAAVGMVRVGPRLVVAPDVQSAEARIVNTPFHGALLRWSGIAAGIVFVVAFFQPGLEAAVLTFGTGLLLIAGRGEGMVRRLPGLGVLMILHALAHRANDVGEWPGPVLAFLALLAVASSPRVARLRGRSEGTERPKAQLGALFFAFNALAYALASGAQTEPLLAMPMLILHGAERAWNAGWTSFVALPLTLGLLAATLAVGSAQWRGALARMGAGWATVWTGTAVLSGLCVLLLTYVEDFGGRARYGELIRLHGPALALGMAGVATLAHGVGRWLRREREDLAKGIAWGRDVWLVLMGGMLALVAAQGEAPDERALPLAAAAIGLAVAVALHCAWRERTGRHVYYVQVAVVGIYALVRALYAQGLRPEHDALFALALGFVLVGVTVLARRAGVPPVERATRRFAALLPVGMALVLPSEATGEAALLAGGSGLLYASLGAVEHSRFFGSLAAAAVNVALLVGALAFELEGLEVYLAPLGLLLLMLGQLFTRSLPQAARNAVRVVGGLLLYVPAAAKLTLRIGMAEDGTYAVIFGVACLVGVMFGMALRIRAYLALGVLFLTLDVATTLVHAGLRDHRIGFLVMTLAGLTIVGGRILATLRRQELEVLMRRVRVAIRGWD